MEYQYEDIVKEKYSEIEPLFLNTIMYRFPILSESDAKDLYNDTFLAIHDNLRQGKIKEGTNWRAYILQIGINLANHKLRHVIRTSSIDEGDESNENLESPILRRVEELMRREEPDDLQRLVRNPEAIKILSDEISFMPNKCDQILRMFYIDGVSMENIAIAIGSTNAVTVRNRKAQCYKKLVDRVKAALRAAGLID